MILFAKRLLLTLLILPLLIVVLLYLLIQTRPAALFISGWINERSDYAISVELISHNLFNPKIIQLKNIKLSSPTNNELLHSETATLEFSLPLNSDFLHFDSVTLEQGLFAFNSAANDLHPFSSERLILKNMDVVIHHNEKIIRANLVNGGVLPWLANKPFLSYESHFRLTAGHINVDNIIFETSFVQGNINNQSIILTTFGTDVAQGQITGKATFTNQQALVIQQMDLSNLKWQFDKSVEELHQFMQKLPIITINRLALLNSSFEGRDWSANDISLSLKHLLIAQGSIKERKETKGEISISASQIMLADWLFDEPIIRLSMDGNNIFIDQIHSRWQGGLVRANGFWSTIEQSLLLDELIIAGIEYTLPQGGFATYQHWVPNWINNITIKKLNLNRNTIVDITEKFPFQITLLDGNAQNLIVVKDNKLGIWQGNLAFNALNATFNKIDLRYPQIMVKANEKNIAINELSAIVGKGLIEGKLLIAQPPEKNIVLEISGYNIQPNIFAQWGWYDILMQDEANISLRLFGDHNITGQLIINNKQNETSTLLWPEPVEGTTSGNIILSN